MGVSPMPLKCMAGTAMLRSDLAGGLRSYTITESLMQLRRDRPALALADVTLVPSLHPVNLAGRAGDEQLVGPANFLFA